MLKRASRREHVPDILGILCKGWRWGHMFPSGFSGPLDAGEPGGTRGCGSYGDRTLPFAMRFRTMSIRM